MPLYNTLAALGARLQSIDFYHPFFFFFLSFFLFWFVLTCPWQKRSRGLVSFLFHVCWPFKTVSPAIPTFDWFIPCIFAPLIRLFPLLYARVSKYVFSYLWCVYDFGSLASPRPIWNESLLAPAVIFFLWFALEVLCGWQFGTWWQISYRVSFSSPLPEIKERPFSVKKKSANVMTMPSRTT